MVVFLKDSDNTTTTSQTDPQHNCLFRSLVCGDRLGYIFGFQDALLLAWLVNIPAWPGLLKNLEKVELIKTTTEHNKIPLVRHVDSKWYGTLVYPQGWDSSSSDPKDPRVDFAICSQIIYKYKKLSCESTNLQVK